MLNAVQPHTLFLGGQKSGKSRLAEQRAATWLAASPQHHAILLATAQAHDEEMAARIARHQADRARRVPQLQTVEEPVGLAACIAALSTPQTLLVVDCLTLWLTNLLMPMQAEHALNAQQLQGQSEQLCAAVAQAPGPVVLVSNEIGLGVVPLMAGVRGFVDQQGLLNQQLARVCPHVYFVAAGLPLTLKAPL